MNWMPELLQQPAASRLGEVLLHFLWQGALAAIFLATALMALRRRSASLRYQVAVAALALLAVLPLITWLWLPGTAPRRAGSSEIRATSTRTFVQPPASRFGTRVQPVLPWLTLGWLTGASLLAVRLAGGWWQAQRLGRVTTRPVDSPWPERVAALAERLGVRRPVRLLESLQLHTPVVLGWLNPVILLPAGLIVGMSPALLEALLAHELAHLRRHDYLVNFLQRIVESLLFYHPAVWWVSERIRFERELCCDDLAVQALGDRRMLAHALVTLAEREAIGSAFALAATGGSLTERVQRLLREPGASPGISRTGYLMTLVLAGCFGAAVLWLGQRGFERKSSAASDQVRSLILQQLTNQLAELDAKVEAKQRRVDELRFELKVPDVVAEGSVPFQSIMSDETRQLLGARAELETRLTQQEQLIKILRSKSRDELPYALNVHAPTPLLGTLLANLTIAEQHRSRLSPDFGPKHPEVERVNTIIAKINAQVDDVVQGIMASKQAQLETDQATLVMIGERLEQAKGDEARMITTYRPYVREKRDLDTLMRLREALQLQLMQERVNSSFSTGQDVEKF